MNCSSPSHTLFVFCIIYFYSADVLPYLDIRILKKKIFSLVIWKKCDRLVSLEMPVLRATLYAQKGNCL